MNLGGLDKFQDFKRLYMPLWTLEEIQSCVAQFYPNVNQDRMVNIFSRWGGLIRYVINSAKQSDQEIDRCFEDAISCCNLEVIRQYLNQVSHIRNDTEISNKIILLSVSPSTFQINHTMITDHASRALIRKIKGVSRKTFIEMIDMLDNIGNAFNQKTSLYEQFVEVIFSEGGTFRARKLVPKPRTTTEEASSKSTKNEVFSITFLKREIFKPDLTRQNNTTAKNLPIVDTIKKQDNYQTKFIRLPGNFPTFDSIMCFSEQGSDCEHGPCSFQVTVALKHPNNVTIDSYNALKLLISSKPEAKVKHFIVTTPHNFANLFYSINFETKDPSISDVQLKEFENAIEQYALEVL